VVDVDPIMTAAIAARTQVGLFVIVLWRLAGRPILGALVTALDLTSDADTRHETVQLRALVELVALAGIGVLFSVSTREPSTDGMTMPCSRSWMSSGVVLRMSASWNSDSPRSSRNCRMGFIMARLPTAWLDRCASPGGVPLVTGFLVTPDAPGQGAPVPR
jgi:hypothetical protein